MCEPDLRQDLGGLRFGPLSALIVSKLIHAMRPEITSLVLDRNPLKPEGAVAVAEMLRENDDIKELHMRFCNIGPKGMEALANALEVRAPCARIVLAACLARVDTRACLAVATRPGRIWERSIHIRSMPRGGDAAWPRPGRSLAMASPRHESLTYEQGCRVRIDPPSTRGSRDTHEIGCVCGTLQVNTSVERLYIIQCAIGDEGARMLEKVLKSNTIISLVHMDDNLLSPAAQASLKAVAAAREGFIISI